MMNALADSTLHSNGHTEEIPTLASLLLSTAESLASPKSPSTPADFVTPTAPTLLLAEPTATTYLASLLALPLSTLQSLPSSLSSLSTSLDTDLSSLAFTRYSSFLLTHAATSAISTSFTTLSSSLQDLLDSTSSLESSATQFEDRIKQVRSQRDRMTKVRERLEEVEELLESPAVVDACVRAGYWAEAIDVAVRLSELHARLSIPPSRQDDQAGKGALVLLNRVREEVSVALASLHARVLESLLQRELKLPGAVRGMAILRRMNEGGLGLGDAGKLPDEALRIIFLAARWRCLRGELESVEGQMAASGIKLGVDLRENERITPEENEESTRWTKRWIEVWREVVGETVGMYSEVFLSQGQESTSTSLPPLAPLTLFLSSALASLSDVLSASLPAINSSSSLSSLLTQLAYCSHSFARHGLEFREIEQVRERVEERMSVIVAGDWQLAGQMWEKEWREGWESGVRRKGKASKRIADWLVVSEGVSNVFATALPSPGNDSSWHHQPPTALALLPPLAKLLNAHATALNSLRLLPAVSLYPTLRVAQGRELERAARVLEAFVDAWILSADSIVVSLDPSPEELLAREAKAEDKRLIIFAVASFGRWLIPWCEGSLRSGVYAEITSKEGRGKNELVEQAVAISENLVARLEGRSPAAIPIEVVVRQEEDVPVEVATKLRPELRTEEERK